MISDKAAFGLTRAERMDEEDRESQQMYAGPLRAKAAVRTDAEAAEYTAEIMSLLRCAACNRYYMPTDGCPLCGGCLAHEEQAWRDHRDELESYHLVSMGVG